MEEGFLEYQDSKVHFYRFGSGERLLIALHGYGDRADVFLSLKTALENDYSVYAIDLPFHGETRWDARSFSRTDLENLFEIMLKKERKARFELMGFSYGGRLILSSLDAVVGKVNKIYLVAPDGLHSHNMFSASKAPLWLRRFFQRWFSNSGVLIALANVFNKTGLLNDHNAHFVRNNLATTKRRERLFNTWVSLSDFKVDQGKAKKILKKYAIPVELYFGKYDKIVPPSAGEKFCKGMPTVRLHLLDAGHLLLNEKLNDLIASQLKSSV